MKKLFPFVRFSTAAALCLGTVAANADYVTPRVPPPANTALALSLATPSNKHHHPPYLRTVTSINDDGPGSLRQAIANSAPGDRIDFALRLPATIVLSKTLVISVDLTVLGPGPESLTVMRNPAPDAPSFRVFEVDAGVVTLAGMTIRNGSAFSGTNIHDNVGGAILNRSTLTVCNCVITGNQALTTDWGTKFNPSVSLGFGAGIFSDTGSELILVNSTLSGNQASAAGGAICTHYADLVVATGCTLSGNTADLQGGGVNFQGLTGTFQNCTISGNATPPAGTGSAYLIVTYPGERATLTLTACTVARNLGSAIGACALATLGDGSCTNRLLSTLVADNDGPNFFLDGNPVLRSLGHNLDSDGTSGLVNGAHGDLVGKAASPIDAKLAPLQDNGGPTLTMALLPGSPALNAAACSDASGVPLPIDQRGFPRSHVKGCDIGAFENQAPMLVCPASRTLYHGGPLDPVSTSLAATVSDQDGDPLTVIWSVNGISKQTDIVAATHPPKPTVVTFNLPLHLGTDIVNVWVSDGKAMPVACSTRVIVRERTPPRIISIKAVPNVLWPPNGKLVPVHVVVQAISDSGPVTSRITSVRSNEPPDGRQPDWIITGDLSLLLRAESSPQGHGRVYTITVQCRDAAGKTSTGTVLVTVPHDRAGGPGHRDGGPDDRSGGRDD
jgi:hypothetical protein